MAIIDMTETNRLVETAEAMDKDQQSIMIKKFDIEVIWTELQRRVGDLITFKNSVNSVVEQCNDLSNTV